ncbi:MAG: hypothetical protein MH252_08430 [Thermosynechococcaceae cyanobacterium MS004]|nr:hypothetical protein [Thermosynechococcaceae cyanobacterium MS004]
MLRPYKVKAQAQVETGGVIYLGGQIVYLDRERATFHSDDIEPIGVITDESSPPFETKLTAYKGADLFQLYYLEKYVVDILSISPGSISTITTKEPHGLVGTQPINIRILSNALTVDSQQSATVTSETSFAVPASISLSEDAELAEVGIPIDLSGKAYTGGLYEYESELIPVVFNATFQTEASSKRVVATGSQKDLERIKIGDSLTIPGAVSNAIVEGLAMTEPTAERKYTRAIALSAAATIDVTSKNVIASRSVFTESVGSPIAGKSFTFNTENLHGKLAIGLDKALLADLEKGLYPIKIYEASGSDDELLFYGVCEVIE